MNITNLKNRAGLACAIVLGAGAMLAAPALAGLPKASAPLRMETRTLPDGRRQTIVTDHHGFSESVAWCPLLDPARVVNDRATPSSTAMYTYSPSSGNRYLIVGHMFPYEDDVDQTYRRDWADYTMTLVQNTPLECGAKVPGYHGINEHD